MTCSFMNNFIKNYNILINSSVLVIFHHLTLNQLRGFYPGVLCCAQLLSHVQLFETPWIVAHQDPLSMKILPARILDWVSTPSSRGSSQPRDQKYFINMYLDLMLQGIISIIKSFFTQMECGVSLLESLLELYFILPNPFNLNFLE